MCVYVPYMTMNVNCEVYSVVIAQCPDGAMSLPGPSNSPTLTKLTLTDLGQVYTPDTSNP